MYRYFFFSSENNPVTLKKLASVLGIKYNGFVVTKHIGFCICYTIYGARMHVKNVFDFKRDDGCHMGLAWFMYYNASFNNISVIS